MGREQTRPWCRGGSAAATPPSGLWPPETPGGTCSGLYSAHPSAHLKALQPSRRGPSLLAASGEGLAGAGFSLALGPTPHGALLAPSLRVQLRRKGSPCWARPAASCPSFHWRSSFQCKHAVKRHSREARPLMDGGTSQFTSLCFSLYGTLQFTEPGEDFMGAYSTVLPVGNALFTDSWSAEKGFWHLRVSCGRQRASQGAWNLTVCEARSQLPAQGHLQVWVKGTWSYRTLWSPWGTSAFTAPVAGGAGDAGKGLALSDFTSVCTALLGSRAHGSLKSMLSSQSTSPLRASCSLDSLLDMVLGARGPLPMVAGRWLSDAVRGALPGPTSPGTCLPSLLPTPVEGLQEGVLACQASVGGSPPGTSPSGWARATASLSSPHRPLPGPVGRPRWQQPQQRRVDLCLRP